MSSYRFDEITGTWVAIAAERHGLPIDSRVALPAEPAPGDRACPFCPGHESETETTVAADADPEGTWRVRVVRNRFPIVSDATSYQPTPGGRELPGRGVHEVVVESPEHASDLSTFDPVQRVRVVRMYRDRLRALETLPDVRAVTVFRNRGRRAGSSQSHPHAQVVATTVLPPATARRQDLAREHAVRTGRTLLDDRVARELGDPLRIVDADGTFVAFCPFASHRAFETWIAPRTSVPSFGDLADEALAPLARMLGRVTRAIAVVTREAAYNVIVRTPGVEARGEPGAAWHLEVLPRTGGDAGFELGTGIDVVPVSPEDAAARLRAVDRIEE